MTDIVFVHPNGVHGIYGVLGNELVSREQPLWPRILAAFLIERGHTAAIVDAEVEGLDPDGAAQRILELSPRVVAIVVSGHQPSASTQQMPGARAVAEKLFRTPDLTVVMMGNHPSALPVRTLDEEPVHAVCDGEGPLTLLGLLRGDRYEDVPGLVWRNDKLETVQNPRAPLLDINDDLHGRAWHLLPPPSRYRSHSWQRLGDQSRRSPYAAIHTSLGCAFACSFCMINVFQHTNRYRMRDPRAVVDEIVMLHSEHGVDTFKFTDELFVLNKKHTRAICEGIIAAGIGGKISSWCYARTDTVDPRELEMFRRAGFDWFALGIESGSESVRDGADKHLSTDDIKSIVRSIESAGINVISNWIVGLPGETEESMAQSLAMARELNTAFSNWYVAQAYPGSALYDEAVAKGWKLPDSWAGYSQHNSETLPLATGTLTAEQILRFRDEAFTAYFTDGRYLDSITQRFGWDARRHVEKMTTYKLDRKILR